MTGERMAGMKGMIMAKLKIWIQETRPSFLLLTPVCVLTGLSASLFDGYPLKILYLLLAFVGALSAHVSINVLNDYFDFKSGIDLKTTRTPFSGGSGILPSGSLKPKSVLLLGMVAAGVVVLIGIYFISIYGWRILPIGLAGMLLILLYTPFVTKIPGVSETAAGGFSLIVLGTYFTQTGTYHQAGILVTFITGLLIADLLLINELPDVEADRAGGRRHLPIIMGREMAARVYCGILIAVYAVIAGGVILGVLPLLCLLGFGTLPFGIKAMRGVVKYHSDLQKLVPFQAMNVLVVLLTPFLISIGLVAHFLVER